MASLQRFGHFYIPMWMLPTEMCLSIKVRTELLLIEK